jgi:hypothetical protein
MLKTAKETLKIFNVYTNNNLDIIKKTFNENGFHAVELKPRVTGYL